MAFIKTPKTSPSEGILQTDGIRGGQPPPAAVPPPELKPLAYLSLPHRPQALQAMMRWLALSSAPALSAGDTRSLRHHLTKTPRTQLASELRDAWLLLPPSGRAQVLASLLGGRWVELLDTPPDL